MNYDHSYHTGHSADIFKHLILYKLISYLKQKPKPMSYLDTHAAFAFYALDNEKTQKTRAYDEGISLIWNSQIASSDLKAYLALIKSLKQQEKAETPLYYPGSAWIAQQLLDENDSLYLCDVNSEAVKHLRTELRGKSKIQLAHQNAFSQLNAWLPPKPARGLLFIDPPYEASNDWENTLALCQTCLARWPSACILIWYPIKVNTLIEKFYKKLSTLSLNSLLQIHFLPLGNEIENRLNGSGLALINAPWGFAETLDAPLKELFTLLNKSNGSYTLTSFKSSD